MKVTSLATLNVLLIASDITYSYVLLTANIDDFKGVIKKMVPETVIDHLVDVITKKLSDYYVTQKNYTEEHFRGSNADLDMDDAFRDVIHKVHINETATMKAHFDETQTVIDKYLRTAAEIALETQVSPISPNRELIKSTDRDIHFQKSRYRQTTRDSSIYMQKWNIEHAKNHTQNHRPPAIREPKNTRDYINGNRPNQNPFLNQNQKKKPQVQRIVISKKSKYGDDINIEDIVKSIKERLKQKYKNIEFDDDFVPTERHILRELPENRPLKTQNTKRTTLEHTTHRNVEFITRNLFTVAMKRVSPSGPVIVIGKPRVRQKHPKKELSVPPAKPVKVIINPHLQQKHNKKDLPETSHENITLTLSLHKKALNTDPSRSRIIERPIRNYHKQQIASSEFKKDDVVEIMQPQKIHLEYKLDDTTHWEQEYPRNHYEHVGLKKPPIRKRIQFQFEMPTESKENRQPAPIRPIKYDTNIVVTIKEKESTTHRSIFAAVQLANNDEKSRSVHQTKPDSDIFESDDANGRPIERMGAEDIKAKTESLWYDEKQAPEIEPIKPEKHVESSLQPTSRKVVKVEFTTPITHLPTREKYKLFTPDFIKDLPNVAEKYDFNEPLPEKDREPEKVIFLKDSESNVNKRYKLEQL